MSSRPFQNVLPSVRKQMKANKGKNTKPEMIVRRLVHNMGYRYRLHRKDLPGKPDLVFGSRKAVIEVRGCFWHGHNCRLAHIPQSRQEYWGPKIQGNKLRDAMNMTVLAECGWRVLEIWECEIRYEFDDLRTKLQRFLNGEVDEHIQ